MLAAIHQLHYLPWLRYFEKIARADVFVVLDDVQYTKNGFQNRNKIKQAGGWKYLTVPVSAHLGQTLDQIEIAEVKGWNEKHARALQFSYSRAPYFQQFAPGLLAFYQRSWRRLNDLNWELLQYLCSALGIATRLVRSSELPITGESTDRLIEICRAVGADAYYTGAFALESYLDARRFQEAGIRLLAQRWQCPAYRQLFPEAGFIPDLSLVDLLFNEGPRALEVLHRGATAVPAAEVGQTQAYRLDAVA